jgi:hypothetical protein
MKRVICSAFSGYTFKSLDELNYQQLVEIFANAERALLDTGIIQEPYSLKTAEDVAREQEEEKKKIQQQIFKEAATGKAIEELEARSKPIDSRYEELRQQLLAKADREEIQYKQRLATQTQGVVPKPPESPKKPVSKKPVPKRKGR